MSGHPHADLMAKAAEIAKTDKEWWRHFEFKNTTGSWMGMTENTGFYDFAEYRLKHRYIDINGYQVPEPVRLPLEGGELYWIACVTYGATEFKWDDDRGDELWLESGLIHLTKEAAEAHVAALLSFTQK